MRVGKQSKHFNLLLSSWGPLGPFRIYTLTTSVQYTSTHLYIFIGTEKSNKKTHMASTNVWQRSDGYLAKHLYLDQALYKLCKSLWMFWREAMKMCSPKGKRNRGIKRCGGSGRSGNLDAVRHADPGSAASDVWSNISVLTPHLLNCLMMRR